MTDTIDRLADWNGHTPGIAPARPANRPYGASPERWAAYWESMRGSSLILVSNAFDAVAAELAAGDRSAARVMARFETDQSHAADGIADALFTLLTRHVRRSIAATVSGVPSRSQARNQQVRKVDET